ncbi:MAG: T9SS type A sorting domain-containing protein [Jejuia sp.]
MKKITFLIFLLGVCLGNAQTIAINNLGTIGTDFYQGQTIKVEVVLTGVDGNFEIGFTGGPDLASSSVVIDAANTTTDLAAFVGGFGDNAGFTNTFINLAGRTVNDGTVTLDILVPSDFTFASGISSVDVQLVTVLNGGSANSSDDITIFVDQAALSTKSFEKFSSFYPNPVNDVIYINNDVQTKSYKVISITGALLKEIDGEARSIDVSDLKTGIYFLSTDDRVGKFVKE